MCQIVVDDGEDFCQRCQKERSKKKPDQAFKLDMFMAKLVIGFTETMRFPL